MTESTIEVSISIGWTLTRAPPGFCPSNNCWFDLTACALFVLVSCIRFRNTVGEEMSVFKPNDIKVIKIPIVHLVGFNSSLYCKII